MGERDDEEESTTIDLSLTGALTEEELRQLGEAPPVVPEEERTLTDAVPSAPLAPDEEEQTVANAAPLSAPPEEERTVADAAPLHRPPEEERTVAERVPLDLVAAPPPRPMVDPDTTFALPPEKSENRRPARAEHHDDGGHPRRRSGAARGRRDDRGRHGIGVLEGVDADGGGQPDGRRRRRRRGRHHRRRDRSEPRCRSFIKRRREPRGDLRRGRRRRRCRRCRDRRREPRRPGRRRRVRHRGTGRSLPASGAWARAHAPDAPARSVGRPSGFRPTCATKKRRLRGDVPCSSSRTIATPGPVSPTRCAPWTVTPRPTPGRRAPTTRARCGGGADGALSVPGGHPVAQRRRRARRATRRTSERLAAPTSCEVESLATSIAPSVP